MRTLHPPFLESKLTTGVVTLLQRWGDATTEWVGSDKGR